MAKVQIRNSRRVLTDRRLKITQAGMQFSWPMTRNKNLRSRKQIQTHLTSLHRIRGSSSLMIQKEMMRLTNMGKTISKVWLKLIRVQTLSPKTNSFIALCYLLATYHPILEDFTKSLKAILTTFWSMTTRFCPNFSPKLCANPKLKGWKQSTKICWISLEKCAGDLPDPTLFCRFSLRK